MLAFWAAGVPVVVPVFVREFGGGCSVVRAVVDAVVEDLVGLTLASERVGERRGAGTVQTSCETDKTP